MAQLNWNNTLDKGAHRMAYMPTLWQNRYVGTRYIASTVILVFVIMAVVIHPAHAQQPGQGRPILTDVYVTTQDFTVLRAGPSTFFDRLAVLPPETTLRATGRTVDGSWFQVAFDGELEPGADEKDYIDTIRVDGVTYGWVAYWLLVWSGDILTLPIDGIHTASFARLTAPRITIYPDTYYYVDGIDPSTRVQNPVSEPVEVEVVGRVGLPTDKNFFWLQFKLGDQFYWTASWEVGTPDRYWILPDGSYIFPYGRLALQLRQELNRSGRVLNNISRRWYDLDAGYTVTCNNIPQYAALRQDSFRERDIQIEQIYISAVQATLDAIEYTNSAIRRFEDVCSRSGDQRFVTPEEVQAALADVNEASRYITLARTLLVPLEQRNPLLGGDG